MDLPHACRQNPVLTTRPVQRPPTDATEVAVASVTVVEHFNVIENIRPGHVPGFVYSLPDTFFFSEL
jgi:hypothetical protein